MTKEHKNLESNTLIKEDLFSLAANAPIGIIKISLKEDYTISYANNAFYQISGYTKEQFVTDLSGKFILCLYEEDRNTFISFAENEKAEKDMFRIRIQTRSGDIRFISVQFSFLTEEDRDCGILCGYIFDITEQQKMEEIRFINQERYRIAISMTKVCVWEYDMISKCIFPYEDAFQKYGFSGDVIPDIPNTFIKSGFIHRDYVNDFKQMYRQIINGCPAASWLGKTKNENGVYVWTKHTYRVILDQDGHSLKAIGISEDVDASMDAKLLYQKEILYRNSLIEDALISFEFDLSKNQVIQKSSDAASNFVLQDITKYDELLSLWSNYMIYEDDRENFTDTFEREHLLYHYKNGIHELHKDFRMYYPDGKITWVQITIHMISKPESNNIYSLAYIKDIHDKKIRQLELQEKAERDLLTHLYNRATMQTMIEASLILSSDRENTHALVMLDVDNFKYINDTFGHDYGDYVLCEIGRRLTENFREKDILGRFGGDEFMIFVKNIPSKSYAKKIGEKVCSLLQLNCEKDDKQHCTSSSVGILIVEPGHHDFSSLYKQVDEALYVAKRRGKNQYCIYGDKTVCLKENE